MYAKYLMYSTDLPNFPCYRPSEAVINSIKIMFCGGKIMCDEPDSNLTTTAVLYTLGWVNLYQKFEMKNIQFVVNSFYQKNGKAFKKFFLAQLACEFAWIC